MHMKKNQRKRIIAFVLAAIMILSILMTSIPVYGTTTDGTPTDTSQQDTTTQQETTEETTEEGADLIPDPPAITFNNVEVEHLLTTGPVLNSSFVIEGITDPAFKEKYNTLKTGKFTAELVTGQYKIYCDSLTDSCYESKEMIVTISDSTETQKIKYYSDCKGEVVLNLKSNPLSTIEKEKVDDYTVYKLKYNEGANKNVSYTVFANEEIRKADGSLLFNKNSTVGTITTDENGIGTLDGLYEGKYYLTQTKASDGHVVDTTRHEFKISQSKIENGQISESINVSEQNIHAKVLWTQSFEGMDASNDSDKINKLASTIKYGVYTQENIYAKDDTYVPANELISIISVKEKNNFELAMDLPAGKYYIKQLEVGLGIVINESKYNFEINAEGLVDGNIKYVQLNEGKNIMNNYSQGIIKGTMKDPNTNKALQGVKIGLFTLDATEFTLENAKEVVTTNVNGGYEFKNLEVGTYYIVDLSAPEGYEINGDVKKAEITIEEQEVTINLENKNKIQEETKEITEDTEEKVTELVDKTTEDTKPEKESKSGKGFFVFIVILLVVILVACVGYLIWYFALRKNTTKNLIKKNKKKKKK